MGPSIGRWWSEGMTWVDLVIYFGLALCGVQIALSAEVILERDS